MDWLTKLPVVGPCGRGFFRTRAWRVYLHLDERKWTRLAASITFTSFLSLFPMLAVSAAVGASLLSPERMRTLQQTISRQVPGISEQLDLQSLADNAGHDRTDRRSGAAVHRRQLGGHAAREPARPSGTWRRTRAT